MGSGYSALNSVFTANQSTATIRFDLGGKATDTGGPAGFSFDDFTIQQVPEPAALSLLALPALLFSRRRPRDRQLRRRRNG